MVRNGIVVGPAQLPMSDEVAQRRRNRLSGEWQPLEIAFQPHEGIRVGLEREDPPNRGTAANQLQGEYSDVRSAVYQRHGLTKLLNRPSQRAQQFDFVIGEIGVIPKVDFPPNRNLYQDRRAESVEDRPIPQTRSPEQRRQPPASSDLSSRQGLDEPEMPRGCT